MTVRRTLPHRRHSRVGAWCFLDHYGPDDVTSTDGMRVAAHPHIGLQTATWLFTGEIDHHDSAGFRARVRPGELNLMTAGRGISHTEYSTADTVVLHGVQLWIALPEAARDSEPGLVHHVPAPVRGAGWQARVFLGTFAGDTSPVATSSPLVGVELSLDADADALFDLETDFEYAVLVDHGELEVAGESVPPHHLGILPSGAPELHLRASSKARIVLIGGAPLHEPWVMWWNFLGRDDAEVRRARADWQALIADDSDGNSARFTLPTHAEEPPIPAPLIPPVRLAPRT